MSRSPSSTPWGNASGARALASDPAWIADWSRRIHTGMFTSREISFAVSILAAAFCLRTGEVTISTSPSLTSGAHIWSKDYGDGDVDFIRGIDVDPSDNVYLNGVFRGTIDFGGGPLAHYVGTYQTLFLAEIDPNGSHLASQRIKADFFEPN